MLKNIGIEAVVDVRRFPTSRWEHFRKDELARGLKQAGIDYFYLGKELGGYRRGGYQSFMATEEFDHGVERLEEVAKGKRIAIVCAERLPWRCHRRFIGMALEGRGWQVVHTIDEKRTWVPQGI